MAETRHDPGGLLAAGKRILRTLHSLAQSRFELFLLEFREERLRWFDALVLAGACLVCAFLALALLTVTVVVIFWEHRILVLVLMTLGYAAVAGGLFWVLRRRLAAWESFAATLDQFKKDQACFSKEN